MDTFASLSGEVVGRAITDFSLPMPGPLAGALGELDAAVRLGTDSRFVTLTGAPGSGKTSCMTAFAAIQRASGKVVLQAHGSSHEGELSFWGLHQLMYPLFTEVMGPDERDLLLEAMSVSSPRRDLKLRVARMASDVLLRRSLEAPVVLCIDDGEDIDEATREILASVSDQFRAGDVATVVAHSRPLAFGARSPVRTVVLLPPLTTAQASALLAASQERYPAYVCDRIIEEADGNPVAITEYSASLSEDQRAGNEVLPSLLPMTARLRSLYERVIVELPSGIRQALLVGVLDVGPDGLNDPGLRGWRATQAERAITELSGLTRSDESGMTFVNRVVRSTVFDLASADDLRAAYGTLSVKYHHDPTRSAGFRAELSDGFDEVLAEDLARAAQVMGTHGQISSAYAAYEKAGQFSQAPAARARWLREAASLALHHGQDRVAEHLNSDADRMEADGPDALVRALTKAAIEWSREGDFPAAFATLIQGLDDDGDQDDTDVDIAMGMLFAMGVFLDDDSLWREIAVRAADKSRSFAPLTRLMLETGLPSFGNALSEPIADTVGNVFSANWTTWSVQEMLAFGRCTLPAELAPAYASFFDGSDIRSPVGAYVDGLDILMIRSVIALQIGQWDDCERLALAGLAETIVGGVDLVATQFRTVLALVAAHRGDAITVEQMCQKVDEWARPRNVRHCLVVALEARLSLQLTLGDFEAAWACAEQLLVNGRLPQWPKASSRMAIEVVEAFVRSGHEIRGMEIASSAFAAAGDFHPARLRFVNHVAMAIAASDGSADDHFRAALEMTVMEDYPFETARAHLLYGEWLRRHFRAADSRRHLIRADQIFNAIGAETWLHRTRIEMRAAGGHVDDRTPPTTVRPLVTPSPVLTPQEHEIATLAAAGYTNKAIAARLYLSPRTVSGHLYNVFPKLGITSRGGIPDAMESLRRREAP